MELAPGAVAASILDGYVTVVYRGVVEFYDVSFPGGPAVNLSAYYGLPATIYSADACPSRGLVVVGGVLGNDTGFVAAVPPRGVSASLLVEKNAWIVDAAAGCRVAYASLAVNKLSILIETRPLGASWVSAAPRCGTMASAAGTGAPWSAERSGSSGTPAPS